MKKKTSIIVCSTALLLSCLFIFTSVDKKICDLFMMTNKNIKENEKVVLVNIDDSSIEKLGSFPWTRDIYAETVLVLRELGAKNIFLDLNFVDESPYKSLIDYDDFLKNAIKVCQNVSVPTVMVNDRILENYDVNYIKQNFGIKNIEAVNDTVTPEYDSIWPCIDVFSKAAANNGFVNAEADADGSLRRTHLISKCDGKYYGQLMFNILLKELNVSKVKVSNDKIILTIPATEEKEEYDYIIKRDSEGSVILNYVNKDFFDYNNVTAWNVYRIKLLENDIVQNILQMEDEGFFDYTASFHSPYDACEEFIKAKDALFAKTDGATDEIELAFDEYQDAKNNFYETINEYLASAAQELLIELADKDQETIDYINDYFDVINSQYKELVDSRSAVEEKVSGAVCVMGTCASSTTDYSMTLYQKRYPNVGVHYILANMILNGESIIYDLPWHVSLIFALLLSAALAFVFEKVNGVGKKILFGVLFIVAGILIPFVVFKIFNVYTGVVIPFVSIALTFIFLIAIFIIAVSKEKIFLQSAFGRYLSPKVIDSYIKNPDSLKLGGQKLWMTAMFTDIRGFSTISEQLDNPERLVALLNKYLTKMSDIILENGGTIDKYEGDAIIAFFGAPIYYEDHAVRACRAAVQMKKAEAELNEEILASGECPCEIFTRIGINTGDIVVGNMGTNNKMNYTMMGNAVNLASRLEGVNKQYDTRGILISEATQKEIGTNFALRALDKVRVVGVKTPLRIFELIDETEFTSDEQWALIEKWHKALSQYEKREYEKAKKLFDSICRADKKDETAKLYSARCTKLIKNPPPAKWDGVFNLQSK